MQYASKKEKVDFPYISLCIRRDVTFIGKYCGLLNIYLVNSFIHIPCYTCT